MGGKVCKWCLKYLQCILQRVVLLLKIQLNSSSLNVGQYQINLFLLGRN